MLRYSGEMFQNLYMLLFANALHYLHSVKTAQTNLPAGTGKFFRTYFLPAVSAVLTR